MGIILKDLFKRIMWIIIPDHFRNERADAFAGVVIIESNLILVPSTVLQCVSGTILLSTEHELPRTLIH